MKCIKVIVLLLCASAVIQSVGCGYRENDGGQSGNILMGDAAAKDYDASRFFVKAVEYQECNEYIVCYEEPDGEVTEVVNMGVQEQPLIIADQRIFYVVGADLVSIDFEGNDRTTLLNTDIDNGVYFEKIDRIEDDWLYCVGREKDRDLRRPRGVGWRSFRPCILQSQARFF